MTSQPRQIRSLVESLRKLDPRHMWGNPVMFVVEIGAVLTTILTITGEADTPRWFSATSPSGCGSP